MAEARDYLGTLSTKKLDGTGVLEEHLRSLRPGDHRVLLLEVKVAESADTDSGQTKVKLAATLVEMVPRSEEDRVREYMRAIRDMRSADGTLPGTEGPSVVAAGNELSATIDRDEDGVPTGKGIWDGDLDAPLAGAEGQAQVTLPAKKAAAKVGSPFTVVSDQDPDLCPFPNCTLPVHEDDQDHSVGG